MTGGELAGAAASAAAKSAKNALSEDESTKAQLARLSEETPEMKAAATAYAKRVEIRQQIVLQIMRPLGRLAGFSKEYFENTFSEELAEKLADVPDDEMKSPPPNVAVPAMQALGYSLDEPNLKDMYLNLLANASDKRKADETHPAFAEVIKQLSSEEAPLLGQILSVDIIPMVRVKTSVVGTAGHNVVFHNVIGLSKPTGQQAENPHVSAWIDNWIRLGLVERDYANHFTDEKRYDFVWQRPEVERLQADGKHVALDKGLLRATNFGRRFAKAVGSDEKARSDLELHRRVRALLKQQQSQEQQQSQHRLDNPDPEDAP